MKIARTLRGLSALAGVVAVGLGCSSDLPPQGQVVLHLDTDAPLAGPAPLFDRVLVELFPPGERVTCAGCTRELAVDVAKIRAGTFSFGFVPEPRVVGWIARLRLFRSRGRATPRSSSTIELVGYLPAVLEDGVVRLTATFRTDDVGVPRGTFEAPIVFEERLPEPSAEGTWAPAREVPCERPAPAGASCVPGGAFFMGDPRAAPTSGLEGGEREHLVVLSPFFLDHREVTVADVRASGLAKVDSRGKGLDPVDDVGDAFGACAYSVTEGPNDARPVNCISWRLAREVCRKRGGDLPTEAQLEIIGTARGVSLFPWGDAPPSCTDAVHARQLSRASGGCSTASDLDFDARIVGEAAGSGAIDRSGAIVDVGANLGEWARDTFALDEDPCWAPARLDDPVCENGTAARTLKGGDLLGVPLAYAAVRRWGGDEASPGPKQVGFRCAYPAK